MTEPIVPLLSVCFITYNHEKFIRQALDSVLTQQTDFPFEVVIGEDCSTDRTREIVFEYQKKYPDIIRVVTDEINIGAQKNVVRTLKECRGKYVAALEGDDYWTDPFKLQKQVDFLEENINYVGVHTKVKYVDKDDKLTGYSDRVKPGYEIVSFEKLVQRNIIHTCSFLFKKDALLYDSNYLWDIMPSFHDIYLFLGVTLNGEIKYLDEATASYRRFVGITQSFTKESIRKDAIEYLIFFINLPTINPAQKAAALLRLSDVYLYYSMMAAKRNAIGESKESLKKFKETYRLFKLNKSYISNPIIRIKPMKVFLMYLWAYFPSMTASVRDYYNKLFDVLYRRNSPSPRR